MALHNIAYPLPPFPPSPLTPRPPPSAPPSGGGSVLRAGAVRVRGRAGAGHRACRHLPGLQRLAAGHGGIPSVSLFFLLFYS